MSDFHHPIGQRKVLVNFWLAHRTCKVLNVRIGLIGTGHDHNVSTHVALHVPTMSTEIRHLIIVDVARLKHANNVAFASSGTFHQWSGPTPPYSLLSTCCANFAGAVFLRPRMKLPKFTVRMLRKSFDVYTGGPSNKMSVLA